MKLNKITASIIMASALCSSMILSSTNGFAITSALVSPQTISTNKYNVPVTSVSMTQSVVKMSIGQQSNLSAIVYPVNASDRSIVWQSSNGNIASVNKNGKVTAKSAGNATIYAIATATYKPGIKWIYASCSITVASSTSTNIPVSKVNLSTNNIEVKYGQTAKLSAQVLPTNASNTSVVWVSSNQSAVSVDQNGNVKGLKYGTYQVYAVASATYNKPGIKWVYNTCTVKVVPVNIVY